MKALYSLLNDDSGATAIEYGLIAALIGIAIVAGVSSVGNNLGANFNKTANALNK